MRHILRLGALLVLVSGSSAQTELYKLTPSDAASFDFFGRDVAIDGAVVVVGSSWDDDLGTSSGSAYFFDAWTGEELGKLVASDGAAGDEFGTSVDVQGQWIVVGAPSHAAPETEQGAVYVFDAASGQELFQLTASDGQKADFFGDVVAIDGDRLIVGAAGDDDAALGAGAAYVFDLTTGQELVKLNASDGAGFDEFGRTVGISGDLAIVGLGAGNDAYVFDVTTGQELYQLQGAGPSDYFGRSVAIEGDRAIVGAPRHGMQLGAAYVFVASSGVQLHELTASDGEPFDEFGRSVAIWGDLVIVGAPEDDSDVDDSGSVYVFDVATGQELLKLAASDGDQIDFFGTSVDIDGGRLIVGDHFDNVVGANSGSAYLFGVSDPIGGSYCGPAVPNSTGSPAEIHAAGSATAAENDVYLEALQMPPGQFGYFLNGPTQGLIANPGGSQGNLCLRGTIGRHVGGTFQVGETGSASLVLDLTNIPFASGGHTIVAGETWNWTAWYRDQNPGNTSNFTDGVSITFQ